MTLTIIWIEYQIHIIRHYIVRSFVCIFFSRFDCAIVFVKEVSIFKQLCVTERKLIIAGSQHLEVNNHHHHCSPLSLHIWSIFYYIYYISRVNHLQPQSSRPHSSAVVPARVLRRSFTQQTNKCTLIIIIIFICYTTNTNSISIFIIHILNFYLIYTLFYIYYSNT